MAEPPTQPLAGVKQQAPPPPRVRGPQEGARAQCWSASRPRMRGIAARRRVCGRRLPEAGGTYRVAVVVRKNPKARRFAVTPHPRFRPPPAVGGGTAPAVGGGALPELDVNLHKHALGHGAGVRFSLESLRDKDEAGRWFVPAMTYKAVARNSGLLPWRLEID